MSIAIALGGKRGGKAIVDDDSLDIVSAISWHVGAQGYVRGRVCGAIEVMHRLILRRKGLLVPGMVVDHINGNKLDNRIANLRVCRQRDNARNVPMKKNNTSGVVGVSWDVTRRKWLAHIKVNRKFINLGWYSELGAAAQAREEAEKRYFGEFAYRKNPRVEIEVEPREVSPVKIERLVALEVADECEADGGKCGVGGYCEDCYQQKTLKAK